MLAVFYERPTKHEDQTLIAEVIHKLLVVGKKRTLILVGAALGHEILALNHIENGDHGNGSQGCQIHGQSSN